MGPALPVGTQLWDRYQNWVVSFDPWDRFWFTVAMLMIVLSAGLFEYSDRKRGKR